MSLTGVAALRIDTYEGSRAPLRHLFELAEDSAVQLEAYLGRGEVLAAYDGSAVIGHLQLVPTLQPHEIELKSWRYCRGGTAME